MEWMMGPCLPLTHKDEDARVDKVRVWNINNHACLPASLLLLCLSSTASALEKTKRPCLRGTEPQNPGPSTAFRPPHDTAST